MLSNSQLKNLRGHVHHLCNPRPLDSVYDFQSNGNKMQILTKIPLGTVDISANLGHQILALWLKFVYLELDSYHSVSSLNVSVMLHYLENLDCIVDIENHWFLKQIKYVNCYFQRNKIMPNNMYSGVPNKRGALITV